MPDTTRVYAVCQLGDLRFAVNADDVVQAIPRPTEVLDLPQHQAPDTPVFMLRGQVLPLLDLSRWLPSLNRTSSAAPDKVMVLRCDTRWVAIAIDELVGMQRRTG
ncbi:MAG: CheW-like domain, partial [Pseudomonadota bacterium]